MLTSDVRLITATNKDLKELVARGTFREDLYYRLNVVTIHTPPLRDRSSDIPFLAQSFLTKALEEHALGEKFLSDRAMEQLVSYSWPGNVRELKNIIERVAILSESETIDQIDDLSQGAPPLKQSLSAHEEAPSAEGSTVLKFETQAMSWEAFHTFADTEFLKFILKQSKGNVSEAARTLELERAYLHRLLKKLGIQRDIQFG